MSLRSQLGVLKWGVGVPEQLWMWIAAVSPQSIVAWGILLSTIGLHLLACSQQLACRNSLDEDVDWWVALKLPRGREYIYIDPASPITSAGYGWAVQPDLASTHSNPLAETLQPLYSRSPDVGSVLYNDEWPNGTMSFNLAHAKGVLGFGPGGGFWLVHSAPRFPNSPSAGNYSGLCCGETAQQLFEGQSFLCVTLARAQLDAAAKLLQLPSLFLYDWSLPTWSAALYPAIASLLTAGGLPTSVQVSAKQALFSADGEPFVAFAKASTPLQQVFLYEAVMEPYFSAGMEVQSWLLGRNVMPSLCPPLSQFESLNVRHVYVRAAARGWDNTFDHGKWAVTIPPDAADASTGTAPAMEFQGAVCVGDQNRMEGQLVRGGGALCFLHNTRLWLAFRGLISAIEGCPGAQILSR